jgi:hypothetical protein
MVDSRVSSADELDRTQLATLIEASRLLNATLERDEVWRRLMELAAKGVDADRVPPAAEGRPGRVRRPYRRGGQRSRCLR